MAFNVTFSQFSKRENSTAQPTTGQTYSVTLKSPSSVLRPRIELAVDISVNPSNWNYCYIPQWSRYYWVTNWTWNNGLWEAELNVDVLASWKSNIGASTLYVLRSASQWDTSVIDRMYPAKTGPHYAETSAAIPNWAATQTLIAGWFCLGLINGDNSASSYGAVSYYMLNYSQMRNFLAYMFSDATAWDDISDIGGDIAKPFLDPMQYITTCYFFPMQFNTTGIEAVNLKFGFWSAPSGVTGYPIGSAANTLAYTSAAISLARPSLPSGISRGEWMYMEPFATYKLVCYPWGVIELPSECLTSAGINIRLYIDYISGMGTLNVYNATSATGGEYSQLICSNTCQFGTPMSLAQITTQARVSDLPQYAAAAASNFWNMALGTDQLIGNAVLMSATTAKSTGTSGGVCQSLIMGGTAYLQMQYYLPVAEDLAENGRPLMTNVQINTLSGYIIVMNGDVRFPGTSEELQAVRAYLEGGFYYE